MPLYLKEVDVIPEVSKFKSALIVPCRLCPAASFSLRKQKPFIELFRRLLKNEAYDQYLNQLRIYLEKKGLRADVAKGNILNSLICMWTSGQQEKCLNRVSGYEAAVVMGCEGAYQTVCEIVKSTDCRVFHGMTSEGIMSFRPKFKLPFTLSLELFGVTPILHHKKEMEVSFMNSHKKADGVSPAGPSA
jgi:hypothetical protein